VLQTIVAGMLLCVAMLPHDTVLVSVPPAGALGGGDGSPAEAYLPDDLREGRPMPPGSRRTPMDVAELEERVDKMVSGLETQVLHVTVSQAVSCTCSLLCNILSYGIFWVASSCSTARSKLGMLASPPTSPPDGPFPCLSFPPRSHFLTEPVRP
jgi:hypothetical protein